MSVSKCSAILIASLFAASASAQTPATASSEPPLTIDEVRLRGVTGRLGPRLGTIVEVSGSVVAVPEPRRKAHATVPFLLSITAVDDNHLREPVVYEFIPYHSSLVFTPKIGDAFRFIGYETGGFEGSPNGFYKIEGVPYHADVNYGFSARFVALVKK